MADDTLTRTLDGATDEQNDEVAQLRVSVSSSEPTFVRRVEAKFTSLGALRADLRLWLESVDVGRDEIDDVLVAVGEAVTNAIEHGHRQDGRTIGFEARRREGEIELIVDDNGTWQAPRSEDSDSDRGRGILLMRQLMDDVLLEPGSAGTKVRLRKTLTR